MNSLTFPKPTQSLSKAAIPIKFSRTQLSLLLFTQFTKIVQNYSCNFLNIDVRELSSFWKTALHLYLDLFLYFPSVMHFSRGTSTAAMLTTPAALLCVVLQTCIFAFQCLQSTLNLARILH